MEVIYQRKYLELENHHFWFVARRDIILRFMKIYSKETKRILDIGCSGGALIKELIARGYRQIKGIDISQEAVKTASLRGINCVYLMNAERLGFKDETFDTIIASDILEHIKEDKKAIFEWKRILKKEGIIINFVPAFEFLWSEHDVVNNHYRRYSKKHLIKLFKNCGFDIIKASYWNFILFFPVFFYRILHSLLVKNKYFYKDQLYTFNKVVNFLLSKLIIFENKLLSWGINFPVGVSVFVIAKKK